MKLFTITATPVRNYKQLHLDEMRDINRKNDTLTKINKREVENYPYRVSDVLAKHDIDGFTVYQTFGYWKGEPEVSFKIEIAIDKDANRIYEVAAELKELYNQESVMLTLPNNSVRFI